MNNYIDVSPNVSKVLNSFRSSGYSFNTAVTDIIDNSIDADATNIDIKIDRNFMQVLDNGVGMDFETIKQALKLGSDTNKTSDKLGKFGFGLKSASFSQANLITVSSKKDSKVHTVIYDLKESIKQNSYIVYEINEHPEIMGTINSGTLIMWEDLYRINNKLEDSESKINEIITDLREYISLVFSEFIRNKQITIKYNNRNIVANDPFYRDSKANLLDNRDIKIGNEIIYVKAYSLHRVDMDSESGTLESQGIYVYRNNRFITNIGWINKSKHPSYNKLRIKLSFGGNEDTLFNIDFKKSNVILPNSLKSKLIEFQRGAINMFNNELGKKITSPSLVNNEQEYIDLLDSKGNVVDKNIYHKTFLLENNIKSQMYNKYLKNLKKLKRLSEKRDYSIEDKEYIYDILTYMYSISNTTIDEFCNEVLHTEPFLFFEEEIIKFKGEYDD